MPCCGGGRRGVGLVLQAVAFVPESTVGVRVRGSECCFVRGEFLGRSQSRPNPARQLQGSPKARKTATLLGTTSPHPLPLCFLLRTISKMVPYKQCVRSSPALRPPNSSPQRSPPKRRLRSDQVQAKPPDSWSWRGRCLPRGWSYLRVRLLEGRQGEFGKEVSWKARRRAGRRGGESVCRLEA